MAAERSGNEGIHVLEEFVCTAIPGPRPQGTQAGGLNCADGQAPECDSHDNQPKANRHPESTEEGNIGRSQ